MTDTFRVGMYRVSPLESYLNRVRKGNDTKRIIELAKEKIRYLSKNPAEFEAELRSAGLNPNSNEDLEKLLEMLQTEPVDLIQNDSPEREMKMADSIGKQRVEQGLRNFRYEMVRLYSEFCNDKSAPESLEEMTLLNNERRRYSVILKKMNQKELIMKYSGPDFNTSYCQHGIFNLKIQNKDGKYIPQVKGCMHMNLSSFFSWYSFDEGIYRFMKFYKKQETLGLAGNLDEHLFAYLRIPEELKINLEITSKLRVTKIK